VAPQSFIATVQLGIRSIWYESQQLLLVPPSAQQEIFLIVLETWLTLGLPSYVLMLPTDTTSS
jgi:hypothetical protein